MYFNVGHSVILYHTNWDQRFEQPDEVRLYFTIFLFLPVIGAQACSVKEV
jgi:hypothetical protein